EREIAEPPAPAEAGVEHRRLSARICTDDEESVGLLDAGDGGVEQIRRAAPGRIEYGAVLSCIDVRRAEAAHQVLEREHLLGAGEIADNGADAVAARRFHAIGDDGEGLGP